MSEPTLPSDAPDEGAWSEQGEAVDSTPAAFSPGFAASTEAGTEAADLNELGAGACIGEMAVLDREPRSASVQALERTRTLRVPGEGFKRVMMERPEMSEAIVAELVRRMRALNAEVSRSARS